MPAVNVRIFDTQNSSDVLNKVVNATTVQDIMDDPDFTHNPGMKYSDSATKADPFIDPTKLVSGDMMIFVTPMSSKAGK